MNMIYERIKSLAKGKISINQLEKELDMGRGSLCRIDINASSERFQKLANYLMLQLNIY